MEASVGTEQGQRKLDGDKAQRIITAMRSSVGRLGAAGATFDHVAAEAGVSRGLLHYYFGSKERLLVEVVRHDAELRLGRLEELLLAAESVDDMIAVMVRQVRDFVDEDPGAQALLYEMFSAARANAEIRTELAELYRRTRAQMADVLRQKEREGVIRLRGSAESVVSVLLALGDGIELQLLADSDWDSDDAFGTGIDTARFLLGAEA